MGFGGDSRHPVSLLGISSGSRIPSRPISAIPAYFQGLTATATGWGSGVAEGLRDTWRERRGSSQCSGTCTRCSPSGCANIPHAERAHFHYVSGTMKRCGSVISAVAVCVTVAACSGATTDGAEAGSVEDSDFSERPGAIASSQKNDLTVSLYSLPKESLVRGNNRVQLEVEADEGAADLDVELETYMPAMGHGPSQQPELFEVSANRYTFDKVVLNMPGLWELHVHFSGDVRDELVFEFDVE